ncbi:hypothetical protein [Piscirickettsia salmonis]|uniref:hypothetical protein n=1 Tax=Piscirickettsia salmonis TaxID=1238 RepID=UPI0002FEC968|nr:hypothetical protein [Piscirickettsia salmonis]APS59086.1 hypothetical protein AVI52_17790 [Piscirickettsia salmonis]ERL61374.1 hypothetical protein K661_02284 [Piscirickettsia salmonis LF-89 = ATCC VR-1361]PEQ16280.1 hypothetical protein X973_08270 [Piscirickettsia salmonis]QGN79238.1 hypothetical protein Psal001_03503 [Piscirickettsia salmonis]QGN82829.1 hypothetical protein Psal002_03529 [Piscirickettsia salmonis]
MKVKVSIHGDKISEKRLRRELRSSVRASSELEGIRLDDSRHKRAQKAASSFELPDYKTFEINS